MVTVVLFLAALTAATVPMPDWLSQFTQLANWPGMDPPYIPLDFIDFSKVPSVPIHQQTECGGMQGFCSFDCFQCVTSDEVYTCPILLQTFDDGPTPHTLRLLDELNHPTTFFTLGVNVVKYPEIYQRAMNDGHLMASHTWSHKFLPSLTNEEIVAQIEWSIWAMNATGHHLPKWFRPPYGGLDNRVRAILRQFGMQLVLWDFDTFDWKLLSDPGTGHELVVLDDLRAFKQLRGNTGLILQHDHSEPTVLMAIDVNRNVLDPNQMAVNQCVGNPIKYIREY